MFNKIFGKPKQAPATRSALDRLTETLEMLDKKEKILYRKIESEIEKAKGYAKLKNKRAALHCLKTKKFYENQLAQVGSYQLRLHDQSEALLREHGKRLPIMRRAIMKMIMLEGAKATTETVDALRNGSKAMKSIQKTINIDKVDRTMEDVTEQAENLKQMQESLSAPVGIAAELDEEELLDELEDLEGQDLDQQLREPAIPFYKASVSASPVPITSVPTRAPPAKNPDRLSPQVSEEEDELAALKAEMAF